MLGKNSNYFMSDLIKVLTKKQKITILQENRKNIIKIALSEFGSHPLQMLIEKASSKDEIDIIVLSLSNKKRFVEICNNIHNTHVIKKIIICFNPLYRTKLNELILKNINELIYDMNGVVILDKFIANCDTKVIIENLVFFVNNNIYSFSVNKYSNYVVQSLIRHCAIYNDLFNSITESVLHYFVKLSVNRYGNYIINLILSYVTSDVKISIIKSLKDEGVYDNIFFNKYGKSIIYNLLKKE